MQEDLQKKYPKIVAKAWSDSKFKEQLIKNPEHILRSEGLEIPKNVKVTICENTEKQFFLVLPQKPKVALTEAQLEALAGGMSMEEAYSTCMKCRG